MASYKRSLDFCVLNKLQSNEIIASVWYNNLTLHCLLFEFELYVLKLIFLNVHVSL